MKKFYRANRGQFIAETPGVLWFLLFCIMFPMMCIASYGYNALFLYYAVRDAAYQAAKESKISQGVTTASSVLSADLATNPGVQLVSSSTVVVEKEILGSYTGAETELTTLPLPPAYTIDGNHVYFIRQRAQANLSCVVPIFPPYTVNCHFECYIENPSGLKD